MRNLLKSLWPRTFTQFYLLFVAIAIPWQTVSIVRKAVTPFHVLNLLLLIVVIGGLVMRGTKLRLPFVIPVALYLLGSLLGMFSSLAINANIYALAQDAYLYIWFATIATVVVHRDRTNALIAAWAITLIFVLGTENLLTNGVSDRLEFSFRNPNRAAAYFVLSWFLLSHVVVPGLLRWLLRGALILAIALTASAAGLLSLVLGGGVHVLSYIYQRAPRSFRHVHIAASLMLGFGCVFGIVKLADYEITDAIPSSYTSPDRIARSASTRQELWARGFETFEEHPLGIGPASFFHQVRADLGVSGSLELHSDFVASLVERGIVGFIGFILFVISGILMGLKNVAMAVRYGDEADRKWAAALAGAVVAYFSFSLTHEVLHHETLWLLLGVTAAHARWLAHLRDQKQTETPVVPSNTGYALRGMSNAPVRA